MIEVKSLTKRFGQHTAVDNISFTVNDGEIVGFLGPNGAGKTTTMNMMTGYISSTAGDVIINGYDILEQPEKAKKQIGYLPDTPPLYVDMTVLEYLNFVCDIKGVKKSERTKMIEDILDTVKIDDVKKRVIKNLSKGYRQRVGLAQALVGYPEVLILDEPTVGLDPKQIIEMRDVIKQLGQRHTVILSSHILSEVSAVCDRVIIISKGKIAASDTPEKLSESLSQGHNLNVRLKCTKEQAENAFELIEEIDRIEFQPSIETDTVDIIIHGKQQTDIREIVFNTAVENGIVILMMKPIDLTLEQIFLQVTDDNNDNIDSYEDDEIQESIYRDYDDDSEAESDFDKEEDEN